MSAPPEHSLPVHALRRRSWFASLIDSALADLSDDLQCHGIRRGHRAVTS